MNLPKLHKIRENSAVGSLLEEDACQKEVRDGAHGPHSLGLGRVPSVCGPHIDPLPWGLAPLDIYCSKTITVIIMYFSAVTTL